VSPFLLMTDLQSLRMSSVLGSWGLGVLVLLLGTWGTLALLGIQVSNLSRRVGGGVLLLLCSSMFIGLNYRWGIDGGFIGRKAGWCALAIRERLYETGFLGVLSESPWVLPCLQALLFVCSIIALFVAIDWLPFRVLFLQGLPGRSARSVSQSVIDPPAGPALRSPRIVAPRPLPTPDSADSSPSDGMKDRESFEDAAEVSTRTVGGAYLEPTFTTPDTTDRLAEDTEAARHDAMGAEDIGEEEPGKEEGEEEEDEEGEDEEGDVDEEDDEDEEDDWEDEEEELEEGKEDEEEDDDEDWEDEDEGEEKKEEEKPSAERVTAHEDSPAAVLPAAPRFDDRFDEEDSSEPAAVQPSASEIAGSMPAGHAPVEQTLLEPMPLEAFAGQKPLFPEESGADREILLQATRLIAGLPAVSLAQLQRDLGLTYYKAARIFSRLEKEGLISGYQGALARKVLLSRQEWEMRRSLVA